MSKEVLLEKLTDKTYRDALISDEIDTGLPMQLRAMREARGWNQKYVAEKMETKQPRFSLMEKPGYGNFSLNTLKKIASLFNVGLIVSFVPFSEMIDFTEAFGRKRLAIPSFVTRASDFLIHATPKLSSPLRPSSKENLARKLGSDLGQITTENGAKWCSKTQNQAKRINEIMFLWLLRDQPAGPWFQRFVVEFGSVRVH